MFLQISTNVNEEHQSITIEVQRHVDQRQQAVKEDENHQQKQPKSYLIFKQQQTKHPFIKPPVTPLKHGIENRCATKSVQTTVSLMMSPHAPTKSYHFDDDVDVNNDDTAAAAAAATINDIINEEAHQLFEQCLAPEIDIEQITLHRENHQQFGISICCNSDILAETRGGGSGGSGSGGETAVGNVLSTGSDDTASELCCADVLISDIQVDGIAARDQRLRPGDQILQIDGHNIKCKEHAERFLNEKTDVTLLISRYLYVDDEDFQDGNGDVKWSQGNEVEHRDDELEIDVDDVEDVDEDDDCENEELLNYENYLHEQAYINLVKSLDKALLLTTPIKHVQEQHQLPIIDNNTTKLTKSQFFNCNNTNTKSKINANNNKQYLKNKHQQFQQSSGLCASDIESEHIYETIPEDSESEPLYCSPYEGKSQKFNAITHKQNVMPGVQQQQLQKKKQQRVAQWLGMTRKQQQQRNHQIFPVLATSSLRGQYSHLHQRQLQYQQQTNLDDHENSSSAYNTGGSNASIPPMPTTTTTTAQTGISINPCANKTSIITTKVSSPKHNLSNATGSIAVNAMKNSTRNEIFDLPNNDEQDESKRNFVPLFYAKTLGHFIDKPKDIFIRQLQHQQQQQQIHQQQQSMGIAQFTAPNLSKYHFVSSQDVVPFVKVVHNAQAHATTGVANFLTTTTRKLPEQQQAYNQIRSQQSHQQQQEDSNEDTLQQKQPMVWKVKRRSDGSRYIVRRPVPVMVRNRILRERVEMLEGTTTISGGMKTTTEDDTISEVKIGRYWPKEDRRRHVEKARERQRQQMQQPIISRKKQQRQQLAHVTATIPSPTKSKSTATITQSSCLMATNTTITAPAAVATTTTTHLENKKIIAMTTATTVLATAPQLHDV